MNDIIMTPIGPGDEMGMSGWVSTFQPTVIYWLRVVYRRDSLISAVAPVASAPQFGTHCPRGGLLRKRKCKWAA